jgi:hypothetical protein
LKLFFHSKLSQSFAASYQAAPMPTSRSSAGIPSKEHCTRGRWRSCRQQATEVPRVMTRYMLPVSQNKAPVGCENLNRHDKMSWWSSMVSAISGDDTVDDEPQLPQNTCLSPPHPHGHMPTALTSPNEFRASPTPIEVSSPPDSSASASAGYWSLSSLTNSLAATSSSLTEVYKVCKGPFHN